MMRLRRAGVGACIACLILCACSGDDVAEPTASTEASPSSTSVLSGSTTTAPQPTCQAPEPAPVRPDLDQTVTVFLICGDGVRAIPVNLREVDRVVPDDGAPLRAALNQLLIGVTPDEAAAGLGSAFSTFTAGQLLGAVIENGIASLNLTPGFASTNNFSTSNLSATVMSQIRATVFQFDEISGLEFTVAGERWCGWENTCDDQPVPLVERP